MPLFVTIGYGDQDGYDRTPSAARDAAHAHDEQLRRRGALMGVAGVPAHVRNHGGADVEVTSGSFMSSDLPLAGFALIEAADLEEALRLVSDSPWAAVWSPLAWCSAAVRCAFAADSWCSAALV